MVPGGNDETAADGLLEQVRAFLPPSAGEEAPAELGQTLGIVRIAGDRPALQAFGILDLAAGVAERREGLQGERAVRRQLGRELRRLQPGVQLVGSRRRGDDAESRCVQMGKRPHRLGGGAVGPMPDRELEVGADLGVGAPGEGPAKGEGTLNARIGEPGLIRGSRCGELGQGRPVDHAVGCREPPGDGAGHLGGEVEDGHRRKGTLKPVAPGDLAGSMVGEAGGDANPVEPALDNPAEDEGQNGIAGQRREPSGRSA